jgi:hypothetical protein
LIYEYHLECKKGCDIDYVIETDIKDLHKQYKPTCPKCGRRVYPNEETTKIIGPNKVKSKRSKSKTTMEQEVTNRQNHKKANDGRRKRKKKVA